MLNINGIEQQSICLAKFSYSKLYFLCAFSPHARLHLFVTNFGSTYLRKTMLGKIMYEVILCQTLLIHLHESRKPQSHQAYDQVTTYLRPKNGPIVETTYDWSQMSYDWSQRSWLIARGKSVAARS